MDTPPHSVLDALKDSITSGTFIDTKFYVFSRREASGRVSFPRPLYCNSRVLDTVPYFSAREWQKSLPCCDVSEKDILEVFSDGFLEGQMKDINEEFPSDCIPHTDYYDYLSDSDLEDENSCSGEDEEKHHEGDGTKPEQPYDSEGSQVAVSETQPQLSQTENEDDPQLAPNTQSFDGSTYLPLGASTFQQGRGKLQSSVTWPP